MSATMKTQILALCLLSVCVGEICTAPLTNKESLVNTAFGAESGVKIRAKREDEKMMFGNQQNPIRVKKSDPSVPETEGQVEQPTDAHAEQDVGDSSSDVEAFVQPIDDEVLKSVAEVKGSPEKQQEVEKQALEAAMTSVSDQMEDQDKEAGITGQLEEIEEVNQVPDVEEQTGEKVEEKSEAGENEDNTASIQTEQIQEETEPVDDVENDLLNTAGISQGEGRQDKKNKEENEDEVDQFLRDLQEQSAGNPYSSYSSLYNLMLNIPYTGQRQVYLPYAYFRKRRSAHKKRARRIKRDLFDDGALAPYELYGSPYEEEREYEADPEEYIELTDDEAKYLYNRLRNYLTEVNEIPPETEDNGYYTDDEMPLSPYARLEQEEPYDDLPYEATPGEFEPYESDALMPYGSQNYQDLEYLPYEKRGMVDPYEDYRRKRYFFPFNTEPRTHWGAFVPEKRDYGENVQRLQRLAMALSDNPDPYYSEMFDNYKKK